MYSFLPKRISTLEIIVIFGVIAVLVMLILPDILYNYNHGDRENRQAKCTSHMRQLSLAMMMAAQDNKETMPAADEWAVKLDTPGKIFDCNKTAHIGTAIAPDYLYVAAFIHNKHGLLSRRPLNKIKDTSKTIELVELKNPGKVGQTAYVSDEIKISAKNYGYDPQTALYDKIDRLRHDKGSVVVFVDGHVEYLKAAHFPNSLLMNSMTAHEPIIKR